MVIEVAEEMAYVGTRLKIRVCQLIKASFQPAISIVSDFALTKMALRVTKWFVSSQFGYVFA